jgi:hypothetical protein
MFFFMSEIEWPTIMVWQVGPWERGWLTRLLVKQGLEPAQRLWVEDDGREPDGLVIVGVVVLCRWRLVGSVWQGRKWGRHIVHGHRLLLLCRKLRMWDDDIELGLVLGWRREIRQRDIQVDARIVPVDGRSEVFSGQRLVGLDMELVLLVGIDVSVVGLGLGVGTYTALCQSIGDGRLDRQWQQRGLCMV